VIDLLEGADVNTTRNSCVFSCDSAYLDEKQKEACILGCNNKNPFLPRMPDIDVDFFQPTNVDMDTMDMSFMSPMLYVHDLYSNMINKFGSSFSSSWTFYMQMNNGKMVIVKSVPVMLDFDEQAVKTADYYETNLQPQDNSATPDIMYSQLSKNSWDTFGDSIYDVNMQEKPQPASSSWFACFSQRSTASRFLLMVAVFLSILGFMWLGVTALVASGNNRKFTIKPEKLSIYGDLEYLSQLDQKQLLSATNPQQFVVEAPPLPLKLPVNSV
jgi:hypothetical protein